MGFFSRLFRALRGGGGAVRANVPQTISPRLMTPAERQQVLAAIGPKESEYSRWQAAHSSWIANLRYNPVGVYGQMMVKRGNKVYTFAHMSFSTFKAWIESASKGKFFNQFLKGRYSRY